MDLNANSFFAHYYRWMFGKLPKDLCSYFWGLFGIILFAPVVILGQLLFKTYNFWASLIAGIVIWFATLVFSNCGYLILKHKFDVVSDILVIQLLIGFGVILLFIAVLMFCFGVIVCIIWFVISIVINIKDRQSFRRNSSNDSKLLLWFGAIRRKYCTRINWK